MSEDKGRQVPYHRSGGQRVAISGLGRPGLAVAALLAMTAAQGIDCTPKGPNDPFERKPEPKNTGRRAEKDARALAKAESKRQRKAAKRAKAETPSVVFCGKR